MNEYDEIIYVPHGYVACTVNGVCRLRKKTELEEESKKKNIKYLRTVRRKFIFEDCKKDEQE